MTVDSRRSATVFRSCSKTDAGQRPGAELLDVVTTVLLHRAVTDLNSDRDGCGCSQYSSTAWSSDRSQQRPGWVGDAVSTDLLHAAVTDHSSDRDGCGWIQTKLVKRRVGWTTCTYGSWWDGCRGCANGRGWN